MEGDILQNFGEFGATLKRYIDCEIERARREDRELYARQLEDEEPYDLSPQELADALPMQISRDTIMHFVHSGVLRGCFIKLGTHFKFKFRASKRAIEAHSAHEVYGEEEIQPKTQINNVRKMPTRKSA